MIGWQAVRQGGTDHALVLGCAESPSTSADRRHRGAWSGPAGLLAGQYREPRPAPGRGAILYFHRAVRRRQPHRQLRSQARCSHGHPRSLPAHRQQCARHAHRRVVAAPGPDRRSLLPGSFDDPRQRRARRRHARLHDRPFRTEGEYALFRLGDGEGAAGDAQCPLLRLAAKPRRRRAAALPDRRLPWGGVQPAADRHRPRHPRGFRLPLHRLRPGQGCADRTAAAPRGIAGLGRSQMPARCAAFRSGPSTW